MKYSQYISLTVWQLLILFSLFLSVMICVRSVRTKDPKVLFIGVLSFVLPFVITFPYWIRWVYVKLIENKQAGSSH